MNGPKQRVMRHPVDAVEHVRQLAVSQLDAMDCGARQRPNSFLAHSCPFRQALLLGGGFPARRCLETESPPHFVTEQLCFETHELQRDDHTWKRSPPHDNSSLTHRSN